MECPYQPGDRYDQFRILEVLGDGSFAWVFAAESSKFEKPVALKLSKIPVINEAMAVRALREIRILGSLASPHVVHITDSGVGSDGRWYMVMELLDGSELSELHDLDEPMPPGEAVKIIYQACLGLEDAHRAGIVHRDLKPSNLWVCKNGDIKVIDFGLARSWGDDSIIGANATQGHMLVGTPHYAQPEQVRSGKLTPASDVYSLGFMLYELLAGRVPLYEDKSCSEIRRTLKNDPLEWLGAHVERPFVPIDRYPEGKVLPAELRDILHSTLNKEPTERPANAGELAERLKWVLPPEYGGLQGTDVLVLHVRGPDSNGNYRRVPLGPGRHTIGVGRCCDVELADDSLGWVYAELDWAGPDRDPVIRPVRTDGFISVGERTVDRPFPLDTGSVLRIGEHHITARPHRP